MDLESIDPVHEELHLAGRANASPFFMSSRAPTSSPQPWELHDVDFLLPGPVAGATRSFFQDSSRRYCLSLHESELAYSSELDDSTKPLGFRSGAYWQDMTLTDPGTIEFSSYLVDDVFTDTASKSPPLSKSSANIVPPTRLRVDAAACNSRENRSHASALLKDDTSVVSPTMVDKKILVTDNDLRLFSEGSSSMGNMRALREHEPSRKSSPRVREKSAKSATRAKLGSSPGGQPQSSATTPRQLKKRYTSPEPDFVDYDDIPAPKCAKVSDQSGWSAPSIDPRWYWGRSDGFHGMQPRLVSPETVATDPEHNGASIFRCIVHQVTAQQPLQQQLPLYQYQHHQQKKLRQHQIMTLPKRKIGIYSPAERRERLKRFHEKRKLRVYHKRIKYDCRKRLANSCPRIKGRFVRKSEYIQAKCGDAISPDTSETASSSEDCLL
ncbi:CCT domain [Phytophthora cinnamomi]|uniref:CCT domain n=1 Tax=Phytophthora cinnamomi TaxID=4785 RepID=UPI00355A0882|nr:CCT domain [Phytophthora cinnamomi]